MKHSRSTARTEDTESRRNLRRRLNGWSPRLAALVLLVANTIPSFALEFPGAEPGKVRTQVTSNRLTLGNRALSATWRLANGSLKPVEVRQTVGSQALALSGEAFQIVLTDGVGYAASAMTLDGKVIAVAVPGDAGASRLADRIPGRKLEVPLRSTDGQLRVVWRVLMRDGGHYVRQEIALTAAQADLSIREIVWLNQSLPGAKRVGSVDGSPVTAGDFFLGAEDPMALNAVVAPAGVGDSSVVCRLPRHATLTRGDTLTPSFVMGVAPPGQMRRAFLCYLERERAHPYRPFLHYNSWYDIAWEPFALNETNCLEAIRTFGERFIKPHGVVVDSMVFDDGWDDPKTLWQFHRGFPHGFTPLAQLCAPYHTRLGVWLSPFGGYGDSRKQRLKFGGAQGYETNATGFSLAGPKYYAAFKRSCVEMIRQYGVNHFKFDGIATGMYANGGADYVLDTEAMRRLMLELRQEDPGLYINLTTGSWPSPFWLRYADSLWRQGDDMGFAGKGNQQQQWLTYRDQEVRKNIVAKGPLYPLNALMTQGVAYSRRGHAANRDFNSAGFKDDVRAFFGSGTSLQELYIQPDKLTGEDWKVLAEAAKWSRANAAVLVDTHWIGGDPAKLEAYGYASWSPRHAIVMLRNPDDQAREFALEVGAALELPEGATRKFSLRSPWAEDLTKPALSAEAGQPLRLLLQPFEVLILEAKP